MVQQWRLQSQDINLHETQCINCKIKQYIFHTALLAHNNPNLYSCCIPHPAAYPTGITGLVFTYLHILTIKHSQWWNFGQCCGSNHWACWQWWSAWYAYCANCSAPLVCPAVGTWRLPSNKQHAPECMTLLILSCAKSHMLLCDCYLHAQLNGSVWKVNADLCRLYARSRPIREPVGDG